MEDRVLELSNDTGIIAGDSVGVLVGNKSAESTAKVRTPSHLHDRYKVLITGVLVVGLGFRV